MIRVGYAGIPGCGKTTTARAFAAACGKIEGLQKVELISEFARHYLSQHKIENLSDQYFITRNQIDMERKIQKRNTDIMITDSPVPLGFIYALDLREDSPKDAMYLNEIFRLINEEITLKPYDLVFYLPPIIEPIRDGIRDETHITDEWREKAAQRILSAFDVFRPREFVALTSSKITDRVEESIKYLAGYTQREPGRTETP
jgi:nicotinamide riboside kinase